MVPWKPAACEEITFVPQVRRYFFCLSCSSDSFPATPAVSVLLQHTWMFQTPAQYMLLGTSAVKRQQRLYYPAVMALQVPLAAAATTPNAREKAVLYLVFSSCHPMACRRMEWHSDTRGLCSWKLQACSVQGNWDNTTRQVCPGKHNLGFMFQQGLGTVRWGKMSEISDIKAGWFWAQGEWATTEEALKRRRIWWTGTLFES